MAIDPGRVKALFQSAIEHTDPAGREAFLDREVHGDAELRDRLDALLAAHDRPAGTLDRPLDPNRAASPHAVTANFTPEPEVEAPTRHLPHLESSTLIDTVIAGRYKIRQEIGEGGMGSVYMAEQLQPVKRMVALKLIKTGMDTRNVLARFESERQALALMDHPNIARVLDAGSTESGRPFFVMELVKGIPINEYCDRHHLEIPQRLALFRQVCSAVQHAHQKGIIHRDLKPSNILVEAHDDKPVPKVIDFGLAKAASGMKLADQSLFTAFGSVTGTPLYMAPEQATFNALDIDTRADIYALGVILYELLTGSTPIRRDSIRRAALDEMLRVIREVEPPTPSSRISTSDALPSLAANRHIEPARLSRLVRGELDWIVMKALAKERERRYDSAIGMANDLERYLNHEPVTAGPPGTSYRLSKFVRRNRAQVVAVSLVLVALVLGVMGTTLGLLEARRQEKKAQEQKGIALDEAAKKEEARRAEAAQRLQADAQRREAERRLAQVVKMNDILGSIFRELDPRKAERDGKPLGAVLGERLDRATAELEGEATGDPLAVARMQMTLGESQYALGNPNKAIELYTKARSTFVARLGPNHPDTLNSMNGLANSDDEAGRRDEALELREQVLELRRASLGLDHPDTLRTMAALSLSYARTGQRIRGLRLAEETLARQKVILGPDHPDTLASLLNVSDQSAPLGLLADALRFREEVLARMTARLGPDHPDTIVSMNRLAASYAEDGQRRRSIELHEKAVELQKAKLGPDHPDTVRSLLDLATRYAEGSRPGRALKLREDALASRRAKLGPDHPDTIASMNALAGSYDATGQADRALKLREEALSLQRARVSPERTTESAPQVPAIALGSEPPRIGPDPDDTLRGKDELAAGYAQAGQLDRAFKLQEETLEWCRTKLGPDHRETLARMNNLALAYREAGRLDRTLKLQEEIVAIRRAKLGPQHPETLRSMNDLAINYFNAGQLDREKKLREEIRTLVFANLGSGAMIPTAPTPAVTVSPAKSGSDAVALTPMTPAVPFTTAAPVSGQPALAPMTPAVAVSPTAPVSGAVALSPMTSAVPFSPARPNVDQADILVGMKREAQRLQALGKYDFAEILWDAIVASRRNVQGDDHHETLAARLDRADLDLARDRLDVAEPAYRTILAECRAKLGTDHADTARAEYRLAEVLIKRDDWDSAMPLLRSGVDRARRDRDLDVLGNLQMRLGTHLLAERNWSGAEAALRESLQVREANSPDDWRTFNTKSMLGRVFLGQKKHAEAEPLLKAGFDGMKQRLDKIPPLARPRLVETLDRLIELAEMTGKPEEAQKWKDEKAQLAPATPKPGPEKQ